MGWLFPSFFLTLLVGGFGGVGGGAEGPEVEGLGVGVVLAATSDSLSLAQLVPWGSRAFCCCLVFFAFFFLSAFLALLLASLASSSSLISCVIAARCSAVNLSLKSEAP